LISSIYDPPVEGWVEVKVKKRVQFIIFTFTSPTKQEGNMGALLEKFTTHDPMIVG